MVVDREGGEFVKPQGRREEVGRVAETFRSLAGFL